MQNNGVILLIEDDKDDVEIFSTIFKDLKVSHELVVFSTMAEAYAHLKKAAEKPFLVICDCNWRNNNQTLLKQEIENYPGGKLKSIPLIFYSASAEDKLVNEAFTDLNVQGFFQKGLDYETIKADLSAILNYWERSISPVIIKDA